MNKKRGRPKFEPTEEQREIVQNLASGGLEHDKIALRIGIAPMTLRKHFRHELDIAVVQAHSEAIGALRAAIRRGDMGAVYFWCKTRLGWRETSVLEQNVKVTHVNALDEIESRLSRLAPQGAEEPSPSRPN